MSDESGEQLSMSREKSERKSDIIKQDIIDESEKIAWTVIDRYFQDNKGYLTRHHIDSFDHFYENTIKDIFYRNNPITIFKEKDLRAG